MLPANLLPERLEDTFPWTEPWGVICPQGSEYGDKPTQTYLYLTGQGGNQNGELEGSLRAGRGQYAEDAAQTRGTQEGAAGSAGTARATDLLAGYDWYNNDVARGEPPKLIQSSDSVANVQLQSAARNTAQAE